jgi:hypothetical protein
MNEIITQVEARNRGEKFYFTGKRCKNGHTDVRYVSNGACKSCAFHEEAKRRPSRRDARNKQGPVLRLRERQTYPWSRLIYGAKNRSKKSNIEFDLTFDWGRDRWTGACEITGIPFRHGSKNPTPFSPSIDRIDPKLGYTKENCRFILFGVNSLKLNGTDSDVMLIARAILKSYFSSEKADCDQRNNRC